MKSIEVQLHEANETIRQQNVLIADLKGAVTLNRRRAARAEREMQLREANLSQPSRDRLHAAFENSLDNAGLRQAINVELKRGGQ